MSLASQRFLQLVFRLVEMRSHDITEISTFVLEQGTAITGSAMGFLGFVSEDQQSLRLHSWSRGAMAECKVPDKSLLFELGKAGWWGDAIRDRRPVIVNDYRLQSLSKKGLPEGHVPIVRFMCVPLVRDDRVVSAMGVANKAEPYTDQDATMLEMVLAAQWAILYQQHELEDTCSRLVTSDNLLQDIAASLPGAVFQFRMSAEEVWTAPFVSDRFLDVLGLDPREVRRDPHIVPAAVSEQDRDALVADMLRCAGKGCSQHHRFRMLVRGAVRTIETHAHPRNESDGSVTWNGVFYDVSSLVHLESQLLAAQKLEAIGKLAAGVAHEINTPMQYIGDNTSFAKQACTDFIHLHKLYSNLLIAIEDGRDTASLVTEIRELQEEIDVDYLRSSAPAALSDCLEGIARVSEIVLAMKSFAHPGQSTFEPVNINAGLRNTLIVSRNEWKYVANVALALEPGLSTLPGIAGELNQVWLNLVVNAAHAIGDKVRGTSELGSITVSSKQQGDLVVVTVRDDGNGIPEKARPHIFEPFFTTKPEGQGTGQGLAIAWDVVVNKHKGRFWFDTEEGVGTTFFVELPMAMPTDEGIS